MLRALVASVSLALFASPGSANPGDDPVATPKGGGEDAPTADPIVDDSQPPPEQKEQLKLFTGTWRCDGKANTEIGEEVPTKITLTFSPAVGGRFIALKLEEQRSKLNPRAITSSEIWGYSAALGGFVRNGADSQGGFYTGTSTGWVGDRFWWTIDTAKNGKRVKVKDTFTRAEGGKAELVFERAVDPKGSGDAYRVFYEGTCRR
jgi:hypothetical protein